MKIIVGAVLGALLIVGVYALGGENARKQCELRIKTAIAKFEKLQTDVKQVVEDYEKVVDIEKGDKDDAAILREIVARLHAAAKNTPSQCLIDPADVTDAGRLRDGPVSPAKRGKAGRAVIGGL